MTSTIPTPVPSARNWPSWAEGPVARSLAHRLCRQFHSWKPSWPLHAHWKIFPPLPTLVPSASRHRLAAAFCSPTSALPLVVSSLLSLNHQTWAWSALLQPHWQILPPLRRSVPSTSRHVPLPALRRIGLSPFAATTTVHCWNVSLALQAH